MTERPPYGSRGARAGHHSPARGYHDRGDDDRGDDDRGYDDRGYHSPYPPGPGSGRAYADARRQADAPAGQTPAAGQRHTAAKRPPAHDRATSADRGGPPTGAIGPRRAHRVPEGHKRRRRRRILLGTAVFTVLVLTAATALYFHLNANLHSDDLYAGATGDAGKEKADPAGRVPLNILVIGSDTRNSELDCKIGGGCGGGGANADVQMVVHVAADRSNATVMSIPRDTVTQLPACVTSKGTRMSAHLGQINSTLTYGPGCTVAAVHELTGIPIDHFVMVDFSGVIAMSDAVGGATICVSDNVYDTYSQLKLSKGKHTLKGMAALQFVRSRHGFGDGSDLGRTYAQHLFLSAVIRSVKSAGTLAHPATLYALADAATKAVTVDKALASIPALLSLASEINAVPTNRITFTTMQNVPDPDNPARVVPTAAARKLFATIIHDQSLTAATASQTPTPTPSGAPTTAAVDIAGRSAIAVKVENGTGQQGRAAALAKFLVAQGFSQKSTSTSVASAATTQLRYGPGQATQAQAVASALKLPGSALQQGTTAGVVLVVGQDWLTGNTFPKLPSVAPTAALNDAHAQTADQSGGCAQVSKYATSPLNGANVTPARAYALSPNVPDSDSGH